MDRVKELEEQATAAHLQAQEHNKQGRFEEAAAAYAEMRRLDAAALELTQEAGCPSCRVLLPRDSEPEPEQYSSQLYDALHTPQPWPTAAAAEAAAAPGGPSTPERASGCITGCLTGDAAATGVQWIYDLQALDKLLAQRRQAAADPGDVGLEFFDPVASPFLQQYTSGRNTSYGEQTLLLLQSLAEQQGLHCGRYADTYFNAYSSSNFSGYSNASTVAFLRNMRRGLRPPASGAEDQQADCCARLAPLLAAYAGDVRLMQLVEAATRVTQNTAAAAAWATAGAAVLERLLLQGCGVTQAVQDTIEELRQQQAAGGRMPDVQLAAEIADRLEHAASLRQQPHTAAVSLLGRNCHMPNALQTPLHAVMHQEWLLQQQGQQGQDPSVASLLMSAEQKQHVYVAAIRDALAAGGCSASRSSYAGALLGAWLGPDAVPASWRDRYDAWSQVERWADAICSCRSSSLVEP